MQINPELRAKLIEIVEEFKKANRGYHVYQLQTERLGGHDLMTMADIVRSRLPLAEKRKIVDGMVIRLQPEHWD